MHRKQKHVSQTNNGLKRLLCGAVVGTAVPQKGCYLVNWGISMQSLSVLSVPVWVFSGVFWVCFWVLQHACYSLCEGPVVYFIPAQLV